MNAPIDPEALTYALVDLLLAISTRTHALIGATLAELDITHALANTLWQLDPLINAPSMRSLAVKLDCDPSTITFLADRLEQKDLIERKVDASNRRVKALVLTAKGLDVRRRLVKAMTIQAPAAYLSAEEQRQLHGLLAKALSESENDLC